MSAMGLESTLPEAVPWNGAIAGFVVFNVELRLRPTLFVVPPVKAVIVDVGVIVKRDISVWATAADDRLMELSIADTAEAGGMLKRPCGILVVI
jgi:hypothetical protein